MTVVSQPCARIERITAGGLLKKRASPSLYLAFIVEPRGYTN